MTTTLRPRRANLEPGEPPRFKPYPVYKQSGIEWLGEIPAHWDVAPLFSVVREREVRNLGGQETNVLSLSYGRIVRRDISDNFGLMPDSFDTYQIVEPGNIVLRLTDLQNDKRSLRVGFVNERGIITSAYVALCIRARLMPEYAAALLHAYDVTKVFYSLGGGVRQTMKFEDLKWLPLLLPAGSEQRAIAAFLDRETARIDALVAKKEWLVELLREQRTALITRAVTKGLDPNVPMKDSGVEWLGEIPAHWEVKRLGQAIESLMDFRGRTPLKLGMDWGGEIPALSAVNVREGHLDLTRGVNYGSQALHNRWMAQGPTRRGDVLFTTEAPLGNAALVPDDMQYILSQRVVLLRPHPERLTPEYLQRFLSSLPFRQAIELQATGSTAEGVKRRYLIAMPILVPRIEEQRAIVAFLDWQTARIDALVAKVRDAIDRLREFRTALISAAVTGKIDVREEVA